MKTWIFAFGLLILSIAGLIVGWHWGLQPYYHANDLFTGIGVPMPNSTNVQEISEFIDRRHPFHLINPSWLHPSQPSTHPVFDEFWKTDLRATWSLYETRARVVLVFIVWFAAVMGLFLFVSHRGTTHNSLQPTPLA